ncbi:MAG: hypothetical protein M3003_00315 [Candidatus Dormibacteraeota bacterium]|nr:hypothetical protein [Candidatus Dormibacteraeota bacterium]
MIASNPSGNYRFLAAQGRPFSAGALADPGFDLVHAIFERPLPIDQGLDAAARHLVKAHRPVQAIAGFELRIPKPFTAGGFDEFNTDYVKRLDSMGLVVDGLLPAARTNVAAALSGVSEPTVYAMSYSVPGDRDRPAFVMSGVAEEKPGDLESMLNSMMQELSVRIAELGVSWEDATTIQLYGLDDVQGLLVENVLRRLGPAAVHGLRWFPSRPPIEGLRLEIDVRSVGMELVLPA